MRIQNKRILQVVAKRCKNRLLLISKSIFQFSWIVIRKIILVVLHTIQGNGPYLVLFVLSPEKLSQFLLYAFCSVVQKGHRVIKYGPLVCDLSIDPVDISQLSNYELFVLAKGGAAKVWSQRDLVYGLEMSQRIIISKFYSLHLCAIASAYLFVIQ